MPSSSQARTFEGVISGNFIRTLDSCGTAFTVNTGHTVTIDEASVWAPGAAAPPSGLTIYWNVALILTEASITGTIHPGSGTGLVLGATTFTSSDYGTIDATNNLLSKPLLVPVVLEPGNYMVWESGYNSSTYRSIDQSAITNGRTPPVKSTLGGAITWYTHVTLGDKTYGNYVYEGNSYPHSGPNYLTDLYAYSNVSFRAYPTTTSGGGEESSTVTPPLWTHDGVVTCGWVADPDETCGWVADPDETCGWVSDATLPCTVTEVTEITYWDFSMTTLVDFSQTTEAATFDSTNTGADN